MGVLQGPHPHHRSGRLGSDALALPDLTSCCKAAVHRTLNTPSSHPERLRSASQPPEQCLPGTPPSGLQTSGPPADLVGKEQVAHSVVFRVLHDGADHLQHRGDACKTSHPHTLCERLLHTHSARQMPGEVPARTTLTSGSSQALVTCAASHTLPPTPPTGDWGGAPGPHTRSSRDHAHRLHRLDNRVGLLVWTDGKLSWGEQTG